VTVHTATGTAPKNVSGEQQSSQWVQKMFAGIAPRYDLLNHLLSFNIDKKWRRALLSELTPVSKMQGATILDLCCGTGDVLLELQSSSIGKVVGADFCHPMLVAAQAKIRRAGFKSPLFEADALNMPLADDNFDAITIAFGFRNLVNYQDGLKECRRVLKCGGVLIILEFSHPRATITRFAYGAYSRLLLPILGGVISGSVEAYSYLPDSISKFPHAEQLREMMAAAGYSDCRFRLLSGGIAALHIGRKE
jgi:demethylmenaquinone methyltransferase/2-methoxy-6-polyprenyl-1,4-benzoquinol methylase